MSYKVKRGSAATGNTIKEMLVSFLKRLVVVLIIFTLIVVVGYFLFQYFYHQFPPFAEAADDVIRLLKGFYSDHGIWATLGLIIFIFIAVWALGEEANRKERKREAMKEMMK